jgi:PAS domain S-box-containing protein
MFGHTAAEAIDQSLDLIIPEDCARGIGPATTRRCARAERATAMATPYRSLPIRKDGKRLSVALTVVPFVDDKGWMTGIAAIMRDVTTQFEETRALHGEVAALQQRRQRRLTGGSSTIARRRDHAR